MSRWIFRASTALRPVACLGAFLAALTLVASPGYAVGPGEGPDPGPGGPPTQPPVTPPPVTPPGETNVPEISTTAAAGALVLLVGGTLLFTERFRRRPAHATNRVE